MLAEDALLFGIRMSRGMDLVRLEGLSFLEPLWRDLREEGLMEGFTLTLEGKLVADRIAVEIMAAFDSA
jgi:hypothetical protein